jgi:glycerate dehydrogenase
MVFALLFELTQKVTHHDRLVKGGRWSTRPDFSFWDESLLELDGLTLGIVGFGQIGQRVATIAQAFGMLVIVHTAHPENYRDASDIDFVPLDALFTTSDVISLHCPLTPMTEQLVNADRLNMMKNTALLINTGRGPLIDEAALADALNNDRIAGAGCDVLSTEPPAPDNPLLTANNCVITPHIAWATGAARKRLMEVVVANVHSFIEGRTQNRVN